MFMILCLLLQIFPWFLTGNLLVNVTVKVEVAVIVISPCSSPTAMVQGLPGKATIPTIYGTENAITILPIASHQTLT
jgi:hypothetical protein